MLAIAAILLTISPQHLAAQTEPEGRKIKNQVQTPKYDPFSAEELFKHIAIPPAPALSPEEAVKSFEIAPGFRLECVAHEPLIVDPVMFEFDADGRIWAVEMRGWMLDVNGTGEGDPIGQVVVLEDTDADGIMDKSTVFLDKLVMPRTVSFVDGGVLIAEPPNLWYCRDTDGDLKCDEKTLVGKYGKPGNPEHTDNGLMHALDNWMYNAKSVVRHKFIDGKLIEEPTFFRGQWGMAQDDYGRLFFNYENRSLRCDLIPGDYVMRNPHVTPAMRRSPALRGYTLSGRTSSDQTMSGIDFYVGEYSNECFPIRVTPGISQGGTELRPDGRLKTFTIACGPTVYRGDQFPEEYRGHAAIPEAAGNLVRFDRLDGDGVHLEAVNAFGEKELLASTDERFRPTCSRTGPDGALYFSDLYRGIIEHVIFMMPYLRNQILSRGLDKPIHMGRIYRIVHDGKPLGPKPNMSQETNAQLVEHLSHPNGWWRDTAQRLLVERKAIDVTGALQELATGGESPLGRIHAFWTLEGIGQLDWPTVRAAIAAEDEHVRATATRFSDRFLDGPQRAEVLDALRTAVFDDPRLVVQLQLVLSLGQFGDPVMDAKIGDILLAQPDPLFHAAGISGLAGRELEMLERLAASPQWTEEAEARVYSLDVLAMAVINEGDPQRIERLLNVTDRPPWQTSAIVTGVLNSELARKRWPEPIALSAKPALLASLETAPDASAPKSSASLVRRIVTWPGDTTEREQRPILEPLTAAQEKRRKLGEAIYGATCFACHKENGKGQIGQAPPLVDSEWANGSLEHLVRIVNDGLEGPVMVNGDRWELKMPGLGHSPLLNDERMAGVLTFVRRQWDNYGTAVDPEQVAAIRAKYSGREMPWTVEELLDPSKVRAPAERGDPLAKYRPLLDGGDAERGRKLFHTNVEIRCNACHKVGISGGGYVGPELTEVAKRSTREYLLESLIEPSAKIVKGFEAVVIVTVEGNVFSGTLVNDKDGKITLALPTGETKTIAAADIDDRMQSNVSSMPPMAAAFTPEQIADLIAYLETLKPADSTTPAPAKE